MLFLFGRSLPQSFSRYFTSRAEKDGHRVIFASMGDFSSGEAFCELRVPEHELKDQQVIVFQSLARMGGFSANDFSTQMLLAGHTLKNYGAGKLWAVTPFGPYARQDQKREGRQDSVASDWFAKMLFCNGFAGCTTVEIHSEKALAYLKTHLGNENAFSLAPTAIFKGDAQKLNLANPVVASPDKGANARADALAETLGAERFSIDKKRSEITHTKITGHRGNVKDRDVLIVDDMGDTMGTAINAAKLIKSEGARRVFFYAAHPVLSTPAWDSLAKALQENILNSAGFCNTIARQAELEDFAQQYGPELAKKVRFLGVEQMLYEHVTGAVANHSAMQPEVA